MIAEFITEVVGYAAGGLLIGVIYLIGCLRDEIRTAQQSDEDGVQVLFISGFFKTLTLCCAILFGIPLFATDIGPIWFAALGLFMMALAAWILSGSTVIVTDEYIEVRPRWRRPKVMRWDEIESAHHSILWNALELSGRGRRVRLSEYLHGFADFVALCRERLPPAVFE